MIQADKQFQIAGEPVLGAHMLLEFAEAPGEGNLLGGRQPIAATPPCCGAALTRILSLR